MIGYEEWVSVGRCDLHVRTVELDLHDDPTPFLMSGFVEIHRDSRSVILSSTTKDTVYGVQ